MDKVTIGIVNYNGIERLPETLSSLQNLNYPEYEIVVADNLSTDGSREWVQENYPEVQCLCLDENRGPAGARNAILKQVETDYILFLDNDITLDPETLNYLMHAMKTIPGVAACHPEICDPDDPLVYRYNGGYIHYLGALIPRNNDCGERPKFEPFDVVSGAALLVERAAALEIGGFDEDYFFNWEDGDFVIRLTLAGYLCVNIPEAIVHHKGKSRGTSKVFYMVRNRWFFMLKLYDWKTLVLVSPMLLIFELSQALFLLFKGGWRDYWKANQEVIETLPKILKKRQEFQPLKVKSDRDWLKAGDIYVSQNLKPSRLLLILNKIYGFLMSFYWSMISVFC